MPVDVSMYPGPAKPVNPIEMMSNLVALKGQMQQNQLQARTMAGQQAEGQAIQGATGPDGSFDPDQFMAAVRANPQAAQVAAQAQVFAQQQRESQLKVAFDKQDRLNGAVASMLEGAIKPDGSTDPTKIDPKAVVSTIGDLVANGVLDKKIAASTIATMPSDPVQLTSWLHQHLLQGMDNSAKLAALMPTPTAINTGGETQFVRTPQMGATPSPLTNTLSPEAAASPVAGPVTEDGAPTTVPLGKRVAMGTVQTGPSPAQAAAGGQYGGQTGNAAAQFEASARQAPAMDMMLRNMTGDLSKLSTGPGSEKRNQFIAGVNSFLGSDFDAEKVSDQESFNKMAAQVVAKQRQMMGLSGTDAQLEAAQHASPGSALSQRGNAANIAIIRGNNDYLMAQNAAWQKAKAAGFGPDKFGTVMTTIQKYVTPLPFQLQHMAADQRKQLLDSMTAADRAKATQEVDFARKNHLIPPKFDQ
jgi:hypothetical protein